MKKSEKKEKPESQSGFIEALKLLTPIEYEVLELTGNGYTAPDIAKKMGISSYTVDSHRKKIRKKLKLNGYGAIKLWWRENYPET